MPSMAKAPLTPISTSKTVDKKEEIKEEYKVERWNDSEGLAWEKEADLVLANAKEEMSMAKDQMRYKEARALKEKISKAETRIGDKYKFDFEMGELHGKKEEAVKNDDFDRVLTLVHKIDTLALKRKKILAVKISEIFSKSKRQ